MEKNLVACILMENCSFVKVEKKVGKMEFILCYIDKNGNQVWESILGEDAMQVEVGDLMEELNCAAEDIMAFARNDEW